MKSQCTKKYTLKKRTSQRQSIFFKRVFFSPTQEEFYFFSSTLRYFNFFAIAQSLTRQFSIPNRNRFMIRFVQTFNITHLRTDRRASANSTYKKLAVKWLNEALCFVSSFVVADPPSLRCGRAGSFLL